MKKYLFYAFGEILLVVIGILIAVSINNWNEARKLRSNQIELAEKVKEQMVLDTINFRKVMNYNLRLKETFDLALRETKPDEPLDCRRCLNYISGNLSIANMDPKVRHLLRDADLSDDELSKTLRKIEEAYESSAAILTVLEETIINNLKVNMDHLKQFKWFAPAIANGYCNAECQDYIRSDYDFRNRLAYTELLTIRAYDSEVKIFYDEIGEFISELEERLNNGN